MNSMTCQATACLRTASRAAAERTVGPESAGSVRSDDCDLDVAVARADGWASADFSCGSHSSPASAAGAASQPRVTSSEPPLAVYSGTLTTEPAIAPTDSAVM